VTQLGGAADRDGATVGCQRRDRRQFVDEARNLFWPDFDSLNTIVRDRYRPLRLTVIRRRRLYVNTGAEAAKHIEQRRAGRIEADVLNFDPRSRNRRRGDQPEGGGGQ